MSLYKSLRRILKKLHFNESEDVYRVIISSENQDDIYRYIYTLEDVRGVVQLAEDLADSGLRFTFYLDVNPKNATDVLVGVSELANEYVRFQHRIPTREICDVVESSFDLCEYKSDNLVIGAKEHAVFDFKQFLKKNTKIIASAHDEGFTFFLVKEFDDDCLDAYISSLRTPSIVIEEPALLSLFSNVVYA